MSNEGDTERTELLLSNRDQNFIRDKQLLQAWTSGNTGRIRFTGQTRNITLAILNVLSNATMNVMLPIYAGTMNEVGGDTFVLLINTFFISCIVFVLITFFSRSFIDKSVSFRPTSSYKAYFAIGIVNALNGILTVYASPPMRTPGYLQGILSSAIIPFTVLCRLIFLRKGKNSTAKHSC